MTPRPTPDRRDVLSPPRRRSQVSPVALLGLAIPAMLLDQAPHPPAAIRR